jgi:DNA-binding NarL/FixJ family response regulator
MKHQISACIIARPGQLREGLQILLKAIPQIELICEVEDISLALALQQHHHPTIALLDCDPYGTSVLNTVQHIKALWPQTCCIALVEHEQEHQAALAAGADVVLVKGVLATTLLTTIERLVCQHEALNREIL